MVKTLETLTGNMDVADRKYLFELLEMLNDPLSRDILGKLASPHSPIFADQVAEFGAKPLDVLCCLMDLKNKGLVTSTMVKKEGKKRVNRYTITDMGKQYAEKYAGVEIKKHASRKLLK